jgi:hypothetical protein
MNKRRRKIKWQMGDVFAVPLKDGRFSMGQTLGRSMPNSVRIALYNEVSDSVEGLTIENLCRPENLISLIEVTKEQLDYGVWKIIGNKAIAIPQEDQPNEKYRALRWIGASFYDAGLAEDFLNAYNALLPWDKWYDPNFLDELLVDISKKPKNLILIKS